MLERSKGRRQKEKKGKGREGMGKAKAKGCTGKAKDVEQQIGALKVFLKLK